MNAFRILLLVPLLALAACGGGAADPPAAEPPLQGARIGGPFALTGTDGRTVRDTDLAGRWRIMYFGYTFCPDVCPVDMQNITAGLRAFEAEAPERGAKVVPVFVSVDPERDTPAVVGEFVANFHPRTVGLTGDPATVAAVAKDFAIYSARRQSPGATGYLVDHSRQTYLMDPDGKPIALLPADESPAAVAATLEQWVR